MIQPTAERRSTHDMTWDTLTAIAGGGLSVLLNPP
jgi:hypothetical protein